MNLIVNGEQKKIKDDVTTVGSLLKALNIKKTERVAVEINKEIIVQSAFNQTDIKTGDCIEIVSFVGGG